MLSAALTLLCLSTPAQAGDPPPPPVFEEERIGDEEWRDPTDEAPPFPGEPPALEEEEAPVLEERQEEEPVAPAPRRPIREEVDGLDELTLLLVHVSAVALVSMVLLPINYYASVFTCGLWPCVIWPGIAAYGITWTGDFLGAKRSAVLWPLVASMVTGASMGAVTLMGAALFAGLANGAATFGGSELLLVPAVFMMGGGLLCGPCVSGSAGAIAYFLVAEPKPPGDRTRFPGLLEPAAPSEDERMRY